ncbi:FecR family protein [Larkinella sp. GY13]|uniref:FecR family protein n=1 Tax=Larkinella sp. GY13 TaxID=3453720 RepID=UPI003EE8EFA7
MKEYKDYNLEDFLFDEKFQQWVRSGSPDQVSFWRKLTAAYPDKKAELEQAREVILSWQNQPPSLSEQELNQEIHRVMKSTEVVVDEPAHRPFYRLGWWKAAAAVVLLAGLGWGVWRQVLAPATYSYEQLTRASEQPLREVVNPKVTPFVVTLPDGSRVTLSENSRISYSTRFDRETAREVFLTGEAFFEVTKNPKRPFLVYTDGLVTRVVGTSFTVRSADAKVSVRVRSGQVAVYRMREADKKARSEEQILLTPNQQATFLEKENRLTRSVVENPAPLQKDLPINEFQFDNTPISSVFALLERTYGLPIVYDKTALHNCYLTVPMSNEPFFTKLDIVCRTIGATYQVYDTQIVITGPGCD